MHSALKALVKSTPIRRYQTGATIYYQGEVPRAAAVLLRGTVRVYGISTSGDEQAVMYHVTGEFFPSSWVFSKAPASLLYYEAASNCEIAYVPREKLIEYFSSDVARMSLLLDYFTTDYSAALLRVSALQQPRARDKLVHTMYYLCQRYGVAQMKKTRIPLILTHQSIGSLVGLTRETTASEMSKLKKKGVMSYHKQSYIVDTTKLLELMGEDSFGDIDITV